MTKWIIAVVLACVATPALAQPGVTDALETLNQQRARKGLQPYQRDPVLQAAAEKAAQIRSSRHISGHIGELSFLPPSIMGRCTGGCAAWPRQGPFGREFGSCCMDDHHHTAAGAAWITGSDGVNYMDLIVCDGPPPGGGGGGAQLVQNFPQQNYQSQNYQPNYQPQQYQSSHQNNSGGRRGLFKRWR